MTKVSARTCVAMTYSTRLSAHVRYQHNKSVTVLTNIYVRTIVIPDLVVYYDVCDCSAAVHIGALGGGGGRDAERHTSELGDIHHGLMKLVAGSSVETAYDWEWVHHWVKI